MYKHFSFSICFVLPASTTLWVASGLFRQLLAQGCFVTANPGSALNYTVTSTTQAKTFAVTFRCTDDGTSGGANLSFAAVDVTLSSFSAPTTPTNFDIADANVTHQVTVGVDPLNTDLYDTTAADETAPTDLVVSTSGGTGEQLALDVNGEITINVASTFTANTTAGEDNEFAAGLYSTGYLLEAAPFGGGTTASVGTEISNTISPSCFLDAGFRDTPTPYTATGSPPNVTLLQATDSAIFDCNATTVDITFTDTANYTAPTGGGASNLTAQHKFQYQLNESGSFTDYPVGLSISNSNTDANGDMKVEVRSTWTPDADKLFASEYTAETTVTVTAK